MAELDTTKTVANLVRENETDYQSGTTLISKYVQFSLKDNIDKIDAYINSKHTTGDTDSMGRDKPFFNIVTAASNIWYRATDIDRKDIRVQATKQEDIIAAFLATQKLQEWMRKENFGLFLNDWGRTLARYGSAVSKFVEKGGDLHAMIIPWNRLIVDTIRFDNAAVIEVLELTPAQLKKNKAYDQEQVENLLNALEVRKTLGGLNKDNKDNFIRVYEVHGDLPLSFLTGDDEDSDTFVEQMHVVSYVAGRNSGDFDDFTLVSGREEKNPYMISHLIEEDGRTQAIGAVEHLFESQWMENHTSKGIKDQLDLASKLIFLTSDPNFVGQNALSAVETGDFLIYGQDHNPPTQLANNSHDISAMESFGQAWKANGNEVVGISDAMLGIAPKSGTAWRQTEAVLTESHSLFEQMTENKGLYLENMLRIYVIPYLKKQLNNKDEIVATLEAYDLDRIDAVYVPNEAVKRTNKKIIERALAGESTTEEEQQELTDEASDEITQALGTQGNTRFFTPDELSEKTWKEVFENLEWQLEVDITGEQTDRQNILTTLVTTLRNLGTNPATDPNAKLVFNKILEMTNAVSPAELALTQAAPTPEDTGQELEAITQTQ